MSNAGYQLPFIFPDAAPDYAQQADLLVPCYHSFIEAWQQGDQRTLITI
ncbi:hypothetical protein AB9R84_12460 [Oceanimonas smirnovii]